MTTAVAMRKPAPAPKPEQIGERVGGTPLVPLDRMFDDPRFRVWAKLEFYNPTGSIKDRVVSHIIDHAERTGLLRPGGTIVENTSGNTGAAIARIAAQRGYRAILTMPDKVSAEKQAALLAFGAEIVVCPTSAPPESSEHYVKKAVTLVDSIPGAFRLDQYDNPLNAEAHFLTTGPEIWRQTDGAVDIFVAAGSTGGTVSGTGRFLKSQKPDIQVVLPDPKGSIYHPLLTKGSYDAADIGTYEVEGVGEDHLAKCMDLSLIDLSMQFADEDAFKAAQDLCRLEGILGGGTAGANIWACRQLQDQTDRPVNVVTVIPDTGLKYLSKFYNPAWRAERGMAI